MRRSRKIELKEIRERIIDELSEFGLDNEDYLQSDDRTDMDRFMDSLRKEWVHDTENVYVSLNKIQEESFEDEKIVVKSQLEDIDPADGRKPWIYLTYDI